MSRIKFIWTILLILFFVITIITGLIQVNLDLHRFIYHKYSAYLTIFLVIGHICFNWHKLILLTKHKVKKSIGKGGDLNAFKT